MRIAIEMALIQQKDPTRVVRGIIFFLHEKLDPKTELWCRIIESYSLSELLEKLANQNPDHPLVVVFQPVLADSEIVVEKEAARCYIALRSSELADEVKSVLLDVFVNWLEQRCRNKSKKEIEEMLLGELPDLRETRSGKDLIEIGRNEGKVVGKLEGKLEGKIECLLVLLQSKFRRVNSELQERLSRISSAEELDKLYLHALNAGTMEEFEQNISSN